MDGSYASTSQKLFKLVSRLLSSRARNICGFSLDVVTAAVLPDVVQPRTVSCNTGCLFCVILSGSNI